MRRVTDTDLMELARRAAFAGQTDLSDFLFRVAGCVWHDGTLLERRERESGGKVAARADRTMLADFSGD